MTTAPERERTLDVGEAHLDDLVAAVADLRRQLPALRRWGRMLARRLGDGGRLLVAGNGGSAAEAQHLTAELVGRFDRDRRPFSALALHAETSAMTAIGNDFGFEHVFARQVTAHARPHDVVLLLSTSGRSPNLLLAAEAGRRAGADVWALTGPSGSPLAAAVDEAVAVDAPSCVVQELHLVAVHLLCSEFEAAVEDREPEGARPCGLLS